MESLVLLLLPITPINPQNSSELIVDVLSFKISTECYWKVWDFSVLLSTMYIFEYIFFLDEAP